MRILLWHGWLLEGSGSNVNTARLAEVFRSEGHDVLLLCQEPNAARYDWIDATGTVGAGGVSELVPNPGARPAEGRCVLLRPRIGRLLPVFVLDEYPGYDVKRFVDLTGEELRSYLDANVAALRAAAAAYPPDVAVTGHAIPGGVIGLRALGPGRYITKIHGSDLEYAVRVDRRYRDLAREGLPPAIAVIGATDDVLRRCVDLVPDARGLTRKVPPGVSDAFRPRPRAEALREVADLLDADRQTRGGRAASLDGRVRSALDRRDAAALDALALGYDQEAPDPGAAATLRALAEHRGPMVGYFGKLIPQKGVADLLAAAPAMPGDAVMLVVGFGSQREWLHALSLAVRDRDEAALAWLNEAGGLPRPAGPGPGAVPEIRFTGRLDHRYAGALSAMDVLVVPSVLDEAFGMVAAEGAAAGALPLLARHSGLAEIAEALEGHLGRPRFLSFERGPDAVGAIAEGLARLLSLPAPERERLRSSASAFAKDRWSWRRTAHLILEAAGP